MTSSHSSSEMLKSIRSRVMPALLTTMSSEPKPVDRGGEHRVGGGPLPHVALDDRDLGAERP